MKCPHCNQEHPEGTKFCPETGKKMMLCCPNQECINHEQFVIPLSYKFCPECGQPLLMHNESVSHTKQQESFIICPYDGIDDYHEGYSRVWINGVGAGYIDLDGNEVIKCQYTDDACDFSEGIAAIYDESSEKDVFINKENKVTIHVKEHLYVCGSFHEGLCRVGRKDTYKLGFIDRNGKLVIDCQFDRANEFHDGLALVWDEKYDEFDEERYETNFRFIDKDGDEIVGGFDYATDFHDGYAVVQNRQEDEIYLRTRIINTHGKTIFSFDDKDVFDEVSHGLYKHQTELNEGIFCDSEYSWIDILHKIQHFINSPYLKIKKGFSEGLGIIQNEQGRWGFMDVCGNIVIVCQFDDACFFSEGLAAVQQNDLWGYIDKSGKLVIPYRYTSARKFSQGRAVVKINDNLMVIDNNGNRIV